MSEENHSGTDIHVADEDSPVLTSYEPNFQRVFARGTLLRMDDDDQNIVQMAFWSSKDTDIEIEDEGMANAVGYRLESEIMMDWESIVNLRNLLDNYIEDHAPEEHVANIE
ncbi:hypothetical protein [Haloarchaeobius salinus]|uniref:hypothetical protein n=2 Tax=Halobacteriales TaxID=2235 RepID=UPI00210EB80D|nr:hypothetical protein [Haloarchaeobius salinus]